MTSFVEPFAEAGAGAEEESADGGFGLVEELGELAGVELVERGEQKDLALGAGEAVDLAEDGLRLLRFDERAVGGHVPGGERAHEELVHLVGSDAAAAVEREVPGDADEPDAEVADVWECALVFHDANEGVLHDVFGFGGVAEDGVGDPEEEGGVGLDERGERGVGLCGPGVWQDQTEFLDHVGSLSAQTRELGMRSGKF